MQFNMTSVLGNSINDIRRNIQDVIGTKANINIGPAVENYGGETFLSEEVAISLLQETKQAFKRCQMVRDMKSLDLGHIFFSFLKCYFIKNTIVIPLSWIVNEYIQI